MKKVFFIMTSVNDAHAKKRAADFKNKGYEVRQFGFLRHTNTKADEGTVIIGQFSDDTPYLNRVKIYLNGLRKIFKTYQDKNIIWYYQGLDVAMFSHFLNPRGNYIYEECDLAHTYIHHKMIRSAFELIDKYIIRKSKATVLTSDGFLDFHYHSTDNCPQNVYMIPNKLSARVQEFPYEVTHKPDLSHISFAFIGGVRFKSLISIADIISEKFPQHEFHFHGFFDPMFPPESRLCRENVYYHGSFKSPDDLPSIYKSTDVVICTYDIASANVRYAEPNKLYEAIYFQRPIVVSSGTFLASKIKALGIGYECDPFSESDVVKIVKQIETDYYNKVESLAKIDRLSALDDDTYIDKLPLHT